MQIIVIFLNEGICVNKGLLGTIFLVRLSCLVVTLTAALAYSGKQVELLQCLWFRKKLDKNIGGRLELLTSICWRYTDYHTKI